jgi:hypothetical protein
MKTVNEFPNSLPLHFPFEDLNSLPITPYPLSYPSDFRICSLDPLSKNHPSPDTMFAISKIISEDLSKKNRISSILQENNISKFSEEEEPVFVEESTHDVYPPSNAELKLKRNKSFDNENFKTLISFKDSLPSEMSFDKSVKKEKESYLSIYQSKRDASIENRSIGSFDFSWMPLMKHKPSRFTQEFSFQPPKMSNCKSKPLKILGDNIRSKSSPLRDKLLEKKSNLRLDNSEPVGLDDLRFKIKFETQKRENEIFKEKTRERKRGNCSLNIMQISNKMVLPKLNEINENMINSLNQTPIPKKSNHQIQKKKKVDSQKPKSFIKRKKNARKKGSYKDQSLEKKLKNQLNDFKRKLEEHGNISNHQKQLMTFLLKFLFDFPIKHSEFLQLSESNQNEFKKFLIDRFFRNEVNLKNSFLEKRSFFLDDSKSSVTTKSSLQINKEINNLKKVKKSDNSSQNNFFDKSIKINLLSNRKPLASPDSDNFSVSLDSFCSDKKDNYHYLSSDEAKQGIIKFLNTQSFTRNIFTLETCPKTNRLFYKFKMPKILPEDILSGNFNFLELQEFLRKREILSIVCKRKQQVERRGKRNDEKTKKVFKRIMKNMHKDFKKKLQKKNKKITSVEACKKFYQHHFGYLKQDLKCFYDPLKRRVKNPKFKSISNDYLAELKKSESFEKAFITFCKEQIVLQELGQYSKNIFEKFQKNPNFLQTLEKAKSKFEWVKFELKVAVIHFLFTFNNAVAKPRRFEE